MTHRLSYSRRIGPAFMLSELRCMQLLGIRARGITHNVKTARTTPTIVNTILSKLDGRLRFFHTTEMVRRTGLKN